MVLRVTGGNFLVELAPLFFGPPQFLDGRGQVEEMHGDDRRARTQVCVADEGVEFASGFDKSLMDLPEAFLLASRVPATALAQMTLLSSHQYGSVTGRWAKWHPLVPVLGTGPLQASKVRFLSQATAS